MLSHLIYVSMRKPNCTEMEIQKILASCKRNNLKLDITGVLLYSEAQFIQYLEGEYNQIITLYDAIKLDNRHKNAVLISSAQINERSFPTWQMGAKKFDSTTINFITDIQESDKEIFDTILNGITHEGNKALMLVRKFFK
jgi:hypothetical protein